MAASGIPVFYTRSRSIEEHVGRIIAMIHKSVRDPELRQLAVKLVSGSFVWKVNPRTGKQEPFVQAWGKFFVVTAFDKCAPRDDACEIVRIWDFVVNNFRYVYDPTSIDTFATAKLSLEAGGGDCFPADTQLLVEGQGYAFIRDVKPGMRIWGKDGYTLVQRVWEKGALPVFNVLLDNGKCITLTGDHKVYVLSDEGKESRIYVSALEPGMQLLRPTLEEALAGAPVLVSDVVETLELQSCWDITTDDGYVYIPAAGVTVSNCDDASILIDALLSAIGFQTRVRVIAVPPDKKNWVHIYPMVGLPKDNPTKWLPLDCTVAGYKPGNEWPTIAQFKDFDI